MNAEILTVIMPVRNGMPFLKDSVNSILSQSYKNFKFIIVNDASEDDSLIYLKSLSDSRIMIVENNGKGIADALNTGLFLIQSKYVAVMDSDDIADVRRFEKQIDSLENDSELVLVGTSIKYFSDINFIRSWKVKLPTADKKIKEGIAKGEYVLSHPTIMMRTEAIRKIGGYNESAFPIYDHDMYLRLSTTGKFTNLNQCYTYIRIHANSFTNQNQLEITKKLFLLSKSITGNVNLAHSLVIKLKYLSARFYKIGVMKYLNGSKIFWLLYIIIAAFLDMKKGFYHLKNKMVD